MLFANIFEAPQHSLPGNPFIPTSNEFSAYEKCLLIEQCFDWGIDSFEYVFQTPPRVVGRVLGFGLLHAPTETGQQHLVAEINDCAYSMELMAALAHVYIHGLIRVFYNPEGYTSVISETESSEGSYRETATTFEELLTELKDQPERLRDLLLERDRHRCVLSDKLDDYAVLGRRVSPSPGDQFCTTLVVPVIMQLHTTKVNGISEAARSKFTWAATTTTIIQHLGGLDIQALLGEKVLLLKLGYNNRAI
ncbi:hypothetical protein P691DRAFT_762302 [Macrolepiota fuliginosa MF-IS2]|uniref:HNH nuclease domain-containing protein n=1 Tax=Macrolepiota fuliginosa MF-IS2 TaxID=1400762 RepID=A0A9P5X6X4_9AGAR|nr:hypothetical protein P691DRAFT_762302 [Macrolepiota fuliginosa MF-IS2]